MLIDLKAFSFDFFIFKCSCSLIHVAEQGMTLLICLVLMHVHAHACEPRHDKTNKMSVRPAKTQISLGIHPVRSESSLCAQWVAKDPSFLHADSEDSDQTGQMPRLICVFAGRTAILLVLSCHGSCIDVGF